MQLTFYFSTVSKFLLFTCLLCFVFSSCSSGRKKPAGLPKLYQCIIHLTQEGIVVDDALVTLCVGNTQSKTWTYSGRSDENGKTVIFTDGYFEGVPLGEYKVLISKIEIEEPPLPDILPTDRKKLSEVYEKIEAGTKQYNTVSSVYSSEETTTLSITIEKKRINEFSFDLGKKIHQRL